MPLLMSKSDLKKALKSHSSWLSARGLEHSASHNKYLLGLYNSLSEALAHRTHEASALEEDSLIAALELTVFTGFQKGGISKSLLEAIGRMQVVRGIQKPMLLAC